MVPIVTSMVPIVNGVPLGRKEIGCPGYGLVGSTRDMFGIREKVVITVANNNAA